MTQHDWFLSATMVVALCLVGCSTTGPVGGDDDDDDDNTGRTIEFIVDEAWRFYGEGDYKGARNTFDLAIGRDSTYAPAIAGRGWCNIELGFTGLSLTEFEAAIAESLTFASAYYGAAFMAHTQSINIPQIGLQRLIDSIEYGEEGLSLTGDFWTFPRLATVNSVRLRVLLASAYFILPNYPAAQGHVDALNPANGLDPSSLNYTQQLLSEIESLRGQLP